MSYKFDENDFQNALWTCPEAIKGACPFVQPSERAQAITLNGIRYEPPVRKSSYDVVNIDNSRIKGSFTDLDVFESITEEDDGSLPK